MSIIIEKLADGLGIGEGSISAKDINKAAGPGIVRRVDAAIQSDKVIVAVDHDMGGKMVGDDGCSDGRFTKRITRGKDVLKRSLRRPKVFGGGATMAMADLIGSGEANGGTITQTFQQGMAKLRENNIKFGAHTAEHALGGKCGCGAIDESPAAINNAVKYNSQIYDQFEALGVSTERLDTIFDNFERYLERIGNQSFEGKEVMEAIKNQDDVVVKELGGPHIESRIVLNFVRGTTVNQDYIRAESDGKIDVFGVDVWRMQDIAQQLHPNDSANAERAFQSMLVYTLATASVLTKGNLPVYAVTPQLAEEPALLAA